MKLSKLTLLKVKNAERQLQALSDKVSEYRQEAKGIISLNYNSGGGTVVRDFYEYYIDGQSLIKIIGQTYWGNEADGQDEFFNSHIGSLGAFGKDSDIEFIEQLLQQDQSTDSEGTSDTPEVLLYRCQLCGDEACGGITFQVHRKDDLVIWTDSEKLTFYFKAIEYESLLRDYLSSQYE